MFTNGDKSVFDYDTVRIRLRCKGCGEYHTAWASNYDEEKALKAVMANHHSLELDGPGYGYEAEFIETGEVRPVLV